MKKLLLSFVFGVALALVSTPASARGWIVYSTGEKLEITQKLPQDFVFDDDSHMNLGVMYNQFSILWIPVWNYGETKWAYVNDSEDMYSDDVTEEELDMLRTEYAYDIPDEPSIGFWNRIGGKLVWSAVILFVVLYGRNKKDDDEEEQVAQNEEPVAEEQVE